MNTPIGYNVVFDLGGVLLRWNPAEIVNNFFPDEATRSLVRREIFQHPDWLDMDRGVLLEDDAIHRFQQRTGCSRADVSKLLQSVKDSLQPIEETHQILEELSLHKIPLYCLSNMPATTADFLRARYAFFRLFHGIVISGEINLMKPDKAIFEHLIARFGIDPEKSIFIDDSLANVESAASLGFETHHFKDPRRCREALRSQFGFDDVLRRAFMDHKIVASHADLNDASQMKVFLNGMPNATDLEALLMNRKIVSTRDYEDDEMTALFVRSNGHIVACYRVEGVTIDESEMIAAQCELLDDWNLESFSRAVHIALDPGI